MVAHLALAFVASLSLVSSHRGLLTKGSCDEDFGSSAAALAVPDPSISWAFKHYFDCSQRAVWMSFTNPSAGFQFYVGAGIPPVPRMAAVRVDAAIIGPGLPKLSAEALASLPAEVREDPVWGGDVGAILHKSPQDQTTCDHLGSTMKRSSEVLNGRCDFYEPYGQTHSWRVLDADNNAIPTGGGLYHVVAWIQEHQSGKVGIALGTWKEDFRTPMDIATPGCVRDMGDFSEKGGDNLACFPVVPCPADPPISRTTCDARSVVTEKVCPDGSSSTAVSVGSSSYKAKMGCGGAMCPSAVKLWDATNMEMHMGMAIKFSGDAEVDFVRGMIPHHVGALDMCRVLVEKLECLTWDPTVGTGLDGLIHFCNHVQLEQDREVAGMRQWLDGKGLAEKATCEAKPGTMRGGGDSSGGSGGDSMAHQNDAGMAGMSDGCGNTSAQSSVEYIAANHEMHAGMSIRFSCNHHVDFVRGMIPHHAGAIAMCQTLHNPFTSVDAYLTELCSNITRMQRAEITWLSQWLHGRGHARTAPCGMCTGEVPFVEPPMPCEDTLSMSSFCHTLGGDLFCKCADVGAACGTRSNVDGFGVMNVSAECMRTCGHCGSDADRPPLFHLATCPAGHSYMKEPDMAMDPTQGSKAVGATSRASRCWAVFILAVGWTVIGPM